MGGSAGEKRRHNQKFNINQNKNEPGDRTEQFPFPPIKFFSRCHTLGGPLEMSKCYFCRVTYIGRERNRFQGPIRRISNVFQTNTFSIIKASCETEQLKLFQLIYLFLVRSDCGICHCRSK